MKKDHYVKELHFPVAQQRAGENNKSKEVRKIQSWLTIYEYNNPGSGTATPIDGDFGPATEYAVKTFQKLNGLNANGIVTLDLFNLLSTPLRHAFTQPSNADSIRDCIVQIAHNHLSQHPRELVIKGESNSGPWVRSYMDGKNGKKWPWCMGFVQAIIDQALSEQEVNFRKYMEQTYSCDILGYHARNIDALFKNSKLRQNAELIQRGDIFLTRKSTNDWTHTGIIVDIVPDDKIITTIEGNTNDNGSRDGYGVFKRVRNLTKSTIDVYSIQHIIDDLSN